MPIEPIAFSAEIQQHKKLNAAFVNFPFSVKELFGTQAQVKVVANFDGKVTYRGSLAKMGGECHRLGLTQAVRQLLGKTFGDTVQVSLVRDTQERTVEIPPDVQELLSQNPEAQQRYNALSFTHKKEFIGWISSAKKPETRERRKAQFIPFLLAGKKGI